jgi:hypothetical protein
LSEQETDPAADVLAAWMREFAAITHDASPVPDPGQLWWKAEFWRRLDLQRQVASPLELSELMELGCGLAAALILAAVSLIK